MTLFESNMDMQQPSLFNPGYNEIYIEKWNFRDSRVLAGVTTFRYDVKSNPTKSDKYQVIRIDVYTSPSMQYLTEIEFRWLERDFVDKIRIGIGMADKEKNLNQLIKDLSWNQVIRLPEDLVGDIEKRIKEIE